MWLQHAEDACCAGNLAFIKENSEFLVDVPEELYAAAPFKLPGEEVETLQQEFQHIPDEHLACEFKIHGHLLRLPSSYARAVFCAES